MLLLPRQRTAARPLQADLAALALLVVTFFGINGRLLCGIVTEHWDGGDQFAPFYHLIARTVRSGHLLLWNPFSTGGSPDFAEPQYGALNPVTILYGLVAGPSPFSFRLYWLGVWLFGGIGMYVLARALRAGPWGSLVVALGFVFSGYYLGHAEHVSLVYSYSFAPWVVWRVRAAMLTGEFWPACQAGALWGLSGLAGNPAVVIPTALFTGMIALAWLPECPAPTRSARWRHYALTMLLVAGVGVAVLAPSYLSFRHEAAGFTDRSLPLPREAALPAHSLSLGWLTSFASPAIPVHALHTPVRSEMDPSYLPVYGGAAVWVLAFFALWRQRSHVRVWIFAAAGLFFLGCAMGNTLPLYAFLYDWLPPFRYLRHPPMLRGLFLLSLAMLAACGGAEMEQRRRGGAMTLRQRRLLVLVAGGCALGAASAFAWVVYAVPTFLGQAVFPLALFHFAIVWLGLAITCRGAMLRPGWRVRLPALLVLLAIVDAAGSYVLSSPMIYVPARPATTRVLPPVEVELGADGFARAVSTRANDNLYVRQPVFISYTAMTNRLYSKWLRDQSLLRTVTGANRVWFAAEAPAVPPTPEVFAAFQQRTQAIGQLVILRHDRADLLHPPADLASPETLAAIAAAPPAQPLDTAVLHYAANDLTLAVDCPRAGYLLLTDRWSRSWEATVNGRPVPVEGGCFLFRLVPVQAGENIVIMRFNLWWLPPLIALGWGTLAAVAAGTWWVRRRPGCGAVSAPARDVPFTQDEPVGAPAT